MNLVEKWTLAEKEILELAIHNDIFLPTHKLFYEDVDNRENTMLQNIYNYSKGNRYNQAVFLIGCGHRKSMISKIKAHEKQSKIQLNWKIYGNLP